MACQSDEPTPPEGFFTAVVEEAAKKDDLPEPMIPNLPPDLLEQFVRSMPGSRTDGIVLFRPPCPECMRGKCGR